jgi:hypothetical protein
MAGITTAMTARCKGDLLFGRHHFAQSRTFTASATSGAQSLTSVSALTGVASGNFISGTNIAAGTRISDITGSSSMNISKPTTGIITAGTITMTGDIFKMALFKVGVAGTYGAATNSYADMTGNTDETTGTGYTAGGTTLTNVDPVVSSPSAFTNFSPNPSWTSSTFSTIGCMIYNTVQNGDLANPAVSVHDFGGTQTVSSGTFTVVMPVAAVGTAVLQLT